MYTPTRPTHMNDDTPDLERTECPACGMKVRHENWTYVSHYLNPFQVVDIKAHYIWYQKRYCKPEVDMPLPPKPPVWIRAAKWLIK